MTRIIAKNTATSDFTLQDMVYHDKPVSLYLIIPPGDITRTMPLLRLILNQLLARLTEKCDSHEMSKKRHPLKLLLDEFPQFGRMEFIEKGLAYLAGYHISAYLIAQDLTQVYKAYGAQQSIIANCAVRVAYAPNTYETAKHLSELLGTKTVVKEQKHFSGHRWDWQLKHMAVGEHETKRALLTPDELLRLPDTAAIIFKTGHAPIYGCKIRYYEDAVFSARAKIPALETDKLPVKIDWTWIAPRGNPDNTRNACMAANKQANNNASIKTHDDELFSEEDRPAESLL